MKKFDGFLLEYNKLDEDRVWLYATDKYKYLCNYGSKSNFVKLVVQHAIQVEAANWVKDRVMKSGNDFQLELSKKYPNSFICYSSKQHWVQNFDNIKIEKVIQK